MTETTGALSGPAVTLVVTESFVAGHPETVCRASRPQCDVWISVFHLKKASLVERHTVVEGPASEVGPRQLAIIGAPVDEEPVATRHPALAAHGMQTGRKPDSGHQSWSSQPDRWSAGGVGARGGGLGGSSMGQGSQGYSSGAGGSGMMAHSGIGSGGSFGGTGNRYMGGGGGVRRY
ncbi:hypothetical protein HPB51_001257 [Rhipicephalus microplus]|uniref:Uncharacterized protein n=1 Tax=Rhipicephalus microplus TaxID=6941 RepID=A0A9J6E5C6_RHIMP|nr:hypothetical protein HPB51_001257 [Rhipicephalus microplus]